MNPWIEHHILMLRDVDEPLTADQRTNIARLFEQCESMLTERTKALQLIGNIVGAGAGCDLVHELPQHVADLVRANLRRTVMDSLTDDERVLLVWLGQEDVNQYGECYGAALDGLVKKGLAEVLGEETETQNPFIAKGHGVMYRAVRVTDAGVQVLRADRQMRKD